MKFDASRNFISLIILTLFLPLVFSLPYIKSNVFIWNSIFYGIILLTFLMQKVEIPRIKPNLLLITFILSTIIRLPYFQNWFIYPYDFHLLELFSITISNICASLIVFKSKNKNAYLLLIIQSLLLAPYLTRLHLVQFYMLFFFFQLQKKSLKSLIPYVLTLIISLISIIYLRTYIKTNNLSFSSKEFIEVVQSSFKRMTYTYQTDQLVLNSNDGKFDKVDLNLELSFKPRIFFSEKPSLKPGVDINQNFYSNNNSINSNSSIPIGHLGSHKIIFNDYFIISYLIHAILIATIIFTSQKWFNSFSLFINLYVFQYLIIPEHYVFYLSNWLRHLPELIILLVLVQFSRQKRIVILSSKVGGFGGIQRVHQQTLNWFDQQSISYKNINLKNETFLSKTIFTCRAYFFSILHGTVLNFHLSNLKFLRFCPNSVKILTTLHGTEVDRYSSLFSNSKKYKWLANSHSTKRRVTENLDISVVSYPFLPCFSQVISKSGSPLFLFVGRLSKADDYKGYQLILDSWTSIRKQNPKAKFIFVGGGDYKKELEKKVVELNLIANVSFVGFISDEELKDLYMKSWGTLLPSKMEGQGLVYLEAMSAQSIPIGLNNSPLNEITEHRLNSILIEDKLEFLVEEINWIIANPESRQSIQLEAEETAQEIFESADYFKLINQYFS